MRIVHTGHYATTEGFSELGMPEVMLREDRPDWNKDAGDLLGYIAAYVTSSGRKIKAGETFNYGSWLIKFEETPDRRLEIHEYELTFTRFVPGALLAMEFWRGQHAICKQAGASFDPPHPDLLVAVSPDLTRSPDVEGVRYDLGPGRSGWILTSLGFSGPVQSLLQEHLLHLIPSRRDLMQYLALPIGYRFFSGRESRVWFDSRAATAS